ncbi:hypothetical protein BC835DRAFT_1414461 [Cytidiella melzeri]|nr:hypothetical protein BC835DRAFT_1414461 [Cytidiella melzeri]
MEGKIQRAEDALKRSDSLVSDEAKAQSGKNKKATKDRARKILANVQQVVSVLEGAAELNPMAKVRGLYSRLDARVMLMNSCLRPPSLCSRR